MLDAGDLDGGGLHDAAEGDDGDVSGAAADVHHHVTVGLGDVDARADGRRDRLLNEVHAARALLNARVDDRALLALGDAGGTQMMMRGLKNWKPMTLWMNSLSIRSVTS